MKFIEIQWGGRKYSGQKNTGLSMDPSREIRQVNMQKYNNIMNNSSWSNVLNVNKLPSLLIFIGVK